MILILSYHYVPNRYDKQTINKYFLYSSNNNPLRTMGIIKDTTNKQQQKKHHQKINT